MSLTGERQTSQHPAGSGLHGPAAVLPYARPASPKAAPASIRLDEDSLLSLGRLFGSSCVTPWSERDHGALEARDYELLELSDHFEVWVIHWPSDGLLQLHDHGGSSGALYVVSGSLDEGTVSAANTHERRSIGAGQGTSFGPRHVHDVVNQGPGVATSVHVYSPPMEKMTFFTLRAGGLVPDHTEYRADPTWAP